MTYVRLPKRASVRWKRRYNREYYEAHAEQLKAKRRARYRASVLGQRLGAGGSSTSEP